MRIRVSSLAVLVLGLSPMTAAPFSPDGMALPEDPLQGRLLFQRNHCDQCHGIAGTGPSIGPSLGEGEFSGTFLELGAALWNHVPGMSVTFETVGLPWPQLTGQSATELLAFLYSIDYLGRPGVAAAGQQVFRTRGCSSCHSIGGGERVVGPDLGALERFASPLYVAQEIWNHGPSMLESMRAAGMPPPSFDEGDLADLSAFIRQKAEPGPREPLLLAPGNPSRGQALFAAKGCSSCHGRQARGGDGGPNLAKTDLHRSAEAIAGTMWNHALAMREVMLERGVGWPQFEGAELADLVSFLYFLPFADPPGDAGRGAEAFASRSCADCHAVAGTAARPGAPVGPELDSFGSDAPPSALLAAMWNHAPIMKKAILGEGHPWPELTGEDLRNLRAFLARRAAR